MDISLNIFSNWISNNNIECVKNFVYFQKFILTYKKRKNDEFLKYLATTPILLIF